VHEVTNRVYIPPPKKKARGRELKQMENCRCLKPCLEKRATGEELQMSGVLVKADIDTGRTRQRIWLRHRATSRKVAGPIPDGVTGIHRQSFRPHYGPGSDSEMSTRKIFLGV
jgi:hypothetical protein